MISVNSIVKTLYITLIVCILVNLGFNFKILDGGTPLYLSQVTSSFFYLVYLISFLLIISFSPYKIEMNFVLLFSFLLIVSIAYFQMILFGISSNEVIKFSFLLISVWFFTVVFTSFRFDLQPLIFSIIVAVFFSGLAFIQDYDITKINTENRLDSSALGGFNTYAFLLSNAMLMCVYVFFKNKNLFLKILMVSIFLFFMLLLFSTFSRGGLVSLIIGLGYFLYKIEQKKLLIMTPILILIALSIFDVTLFQNYEIVLDRYFGEDITSFSGSGRVDIWKYLISDMLSSPLHLLFGNGVGSISIDLENSPFMLTSAHNQYLEYFYYFGIIIGTFLIAPVTFTYTKLKRTDPSIEKFLMLAIFLQFSIGLILDSYLQASQMGWYFGMIIGLLIAYPRNINALNKKNLLSKT
tara:strand:- start:3968 stop:5194 length:1227 start_codon:yes stop_codon:yes gene_type:complete